MLRHESRRMSSRQRVDVIRVDRRGLAQAQTRQQRSVLTRRIAKDAEQIARWQTRATRHSSRASEVAARPHDIGQRDAGLLAGCPRHDRIPKRRLR